MLHSDGPYEFYNFSRLSCLRDVCPKVVLICLRNGMHSFFYWFPLEFPDENSLPCVHSERKILIQFWKMSDFRSDFKRFEMNTTFKSWTTRPNPILHLSWLACNTCEFSFRTVLVMRRKLRTIPKQGLIWVVFDPCADHAESLPVRLVGQPSPAKKLRGKPHKEGDTPTLSLTLT